MKVEKRENVTILRLQNKKTEPEERRPNLKQSLRELRIRILPCQQPVITDTFLIDLILKTFGADLEYHVLISDAVYRTLTVEMMQDELSKDATDALPYVAEFSDCDDFSDALLGALTKSTWNQGYAIGQLWYYTKEYGHAVNLFCDGEKIWIVEPQNDSISEFDSVTMQAFMVKF